MEYQKEYVMTIEKFHLVSHGLCPYVQRSVIVLTEKQIPFKRTDIDLLNTPEWFSDISPLGKVPLLIVDHNHVIFESAVICEYLNEITVGSLHPSDPLEKAYHRSWIEFGSGILDSISGLYNAKSQNDFDLQHIEIQEKFQILEKELGDSRYFSGDQFQMIDAVYGTVFRYFDTFDYILDLAIFDELPKAKKWRLALQLRYSVKHAVLPEYCELLFKFLKDRNSYISQIIAKNSNELLKYVN